MYLLAEMVSEKSNEYFFVQIDVDIGSSTVANGVLGLVCGVITTLVVDMAFLIQVRVYKFFKSCLDHCNSGCPVQHVTGKQAVV